MKIQCSYICCKRHVRRNPKILFRWKCPLVDKWNWILILILWKKSPRTPLWVVWFLFEKNIFLTKRLTVRRQDKQNSKNIGFCIARSIWSFYWPSAIQVQGFQKTFILIWVLGSVKDDCQFSRCTPWKQSIVLKNDGVWQIWAPTTDFLWKTMEKPMKLLDFMKFHWKKLIQTKFWPKSNSKQ